MGFEWQYFLVKLGPNGPNALWWVDMGRQRYRLFVLVREGESSSRQTDSFELCDTSPIAVTNNWDEILVPIDELLL